MVELVFSLCAFLPLCSHPPLPLFSLSRSLFFLPGSLLFIRIATVCLHIYFSLQVGRQSAPSKTISPIHPSILCYLSSSPPSACLLPSFINIFPSTPPYKLCLLLLAPLPSFFLLTTPRLLLFCKNDKAAGRRKGLWSQPR